MTHWFRFRHFRTRLLVLIVGLVAALQIATFLIVAHANRSNALTSIDDALTRASRQFEVSTHRREEALLLAARLMANDYAMKQLFLTDEFSAPTARSALTSYQGRIQAPLILLLDPTGDLLSGTRSAISADDLAPFRALISTAEDAEAQQASGYGYFDGELHQIVLVPLLAPPPIVVAWVGIGFPINAATAAELKASADVEVTFLSGGSEARILASTLPVPLADELARQNPRADARLLRLQAEDYVTAIRVLPLESAEPHSSPCNAPSECNSPRHGSSSKPSSTTPSSASSSPSSPRSVLRATSVALCNNSLRTPSMSRLAITRANSISSAPTNSANSPPPSIT